jgi:uncharacterized protein (TIGR02594 family)
MFRYFIPILIIFMSGCEFTVPEVPPGTPIHSASEMVFMHEKTHRKELKAFLGVDPVQYEWCAAFMNAILKKHDIPGSESVSEYPLMARSFLDWGETVNEPQIGDILIFSRGNDGWQGHVGFYAGKSGNDYLVLGGNQNDKVSVMKYSGKRLLGIRRFIPDPDISYKTF